MGRNRPIEAKWGAGPWTVIAPAPTDGVFSGSLTDQAVGQGTLSVRQVGNDDVRQDVVYVGVGSVFILTGQSNVSGRGVNSQTYNHASLKACMLGNDNQWKELIDPTDIATNQVDSISYDSSIDAAGSIWPLVATLLMAELNWPVAFVQCARGGNGNARWQPPADPFNRSTLFGSAMYRWQLAGGCEFFIYGAGEPGVDAAVSDYGVYQPIALAIGTVTGAKVMRWKNNYCTGGTISENAGHAAAVDYIWANLASFNGLVGPDLHGIISTDGYHMTTDEQLETAAGLTATAILNVISP